MPGPGEFDVNYNCLEKKIRVVRFQERRGHFLNLKSDGDIGPTKYVCKKLDDGPSYRFGT